MKLTSSPAADVLKQHDAGSVRKSILLITAVSLGTSALLAAVLWAYNPQYLRNASAFPLIDSATYLALARNLLLGAPYARNPGPHTCANTSYHQSPKHWFLECTISAARHADKPCAGTE